MRIHEITEGVVRRHGVPDWEQICEEQEAKEYPFRGILSPMPNVSIRKPWWAKVDMDGVLVGLGLFLLAALLVGCKASGIDAVTTANLDRAAWLTRYADKANLSTVRTYQCISEMYSLAYRPIDSGPICRDACELIKQVNAFVQTAPAGIENPQQYKLDESGVCTKKKVKP